MKRAMGLPAVSCPECNAGLDLGIGTSGASVTALAVGCTSCRWTLDLLKEARNQYAVNRDRAGKVARETSRAITDARRHLPRNRG